MQSESLKLNKRFLRYLFLFAFIGLSLIQLYLANNLATQGKILEETEREIESLEKENRLLQSEALSLTSLSKLKEKAEKKGFVKITKIVNYTRETSIALKNE